MQQEEKDHASEKAVMEAKSLEAAELRDTNERLVANFNELREQEQARASEVAKQKQSLQALQEKFKCLWDYMTGLTNDHNSLRAKAVQLARSAEEAQKEKATFQDSLNEVTKSLQKSEASRQAALNTAKNMVRMLDEQIKEQNNQIESQDDLLKEQREQNKQLREELSKLTEAQTESLASLVANSSAMGENLKSLPGNDTLKDIVETACNQNDLRILVERLAVQLQGLTERDTLGSDSLQFLRDFVQGHDNRYARPSPTLRETKIA